MEGVETREKTEVLEHGHNRFNLLFSLAIALFAVASLAWSRMLLGLGFFFAAWGLAMGLAGFLGWGFRPGVSIFG